jgi:hypothetical protein
MTTSLVKIHLIDFRSLQPILLQTWEVEVEPETPFLDFVPPLLNDSSWDSDYRNLDGWDIGLIVPEGMPQPLSFKAFFLPQFVIRADEAIEFVPNARGVKRFAPGDVQRTVRAGVLEADTNEFVVFKYGGVGGGDALSELLEWFFQSGFDTVFWTGVGLLARPTFRRLREAKTVRRARVVAKLWVEQQIYSPYQLRAVVDLYDHWNPSVLAKRLRIGRDEAKRLLELLGYVADARSDWRIGSGRKAKARRAAWFKAEPKDHMGNLFELHPRGLSSK